MEGKKHRALGEDCKAVSEVYGQLLMISIVIIAFSTIALTVFSELAIENSQRMPHTDLQENINIGDDTIQIFHIGGEAIDLSAIKVILLFADGQKEEFSKSDFKDPDGTELDDDVLTLGDCIVINDKKIKSGVDIDMFVVHTPSEQVIQKTVLQSISWERPEWITPYPYGSVCDKSGNNNETFLPTELVGCIGDGLVTDCHMEKGFESYEIFNFGIEQCEFNIKDPLTTVLLKVVYSSHDNSQKDMKLEINVGGSDWIDVASIKGPKQKDPDTYDITSYVNTVAKLDKLTVRFSANGNAASKNKDVWFDFVGVHFESESKEKNTPTITWSNPADIVYGTPLSSTQLSASASVPGTFTYTPASGTILNAGTQTLHVDFTPTDTANYNTASQDVAINVNKADPIVAWSNPADIVYGTPLSSTQLNALAPVSGTYAYTPLAGTILNVGTQPLHVDFTPTDTANYNTASADVQINVIVPQVPIADFTATPTSGKHPLTVSFTDTSTGTPTSWKWDFGDGSTSTAQSPSHKYTKKVTYTVSLTVKNGFGTNTTTKTNYIIVS